MWRVSRERKEERTVGPHGIFPTFLLILSLVSLVNIFSPLSTFISNLYALSSGLQGRGQRW